MSKVATVLVLLQTALLSFLIWHVASAERVRADSDGAQLRFIAPTPQSSPVARGPGQEATVGIDEALIRRIIREELASSRLQKLEDGYIADVTSLPDPQMDLEYQRRSLIVDGRLNYFGQVGQITPEEMTSLQADIARLRPEDREAMFRHLVRALNSGAIKGRL
jgi:hypothetical protein